MSHLVAEAPGIRAESACTVKLIVDQTGRQSVLGLDEESWLGLSTGRHGFIILGIDDILREADRLHPDTDYHRIIFRVNGLDHHGKYIGVTVLAKAIAPGRIVLSIHVYHSVKHARSPKFESGYQVEVGPNELSQYTTLIEALI